jgi:NTE family protein
MWGAKDAQMSRSALVLQGGGALGAFEFGAAQALHEQGLAPNVIAGVSIGAVTAALLARPANGEPLSTLEAFWKQVTVPGSLFPPVLRPYASFFGNPHFFDLRPEFFAWSSWFIWPTWTHFYETTPLRDTLTELVDLEKLRDPNADPVLLVSATNIEKGKIEYFCSRNGGLSLDHILASSSLPPAFPKTKIGAGAFWDGGLFDNTPLGAVLDVLNTTLDEDRAVYVVNLFPNKGPIPTSLPGVYERMKNLQFANKTSEDVKLLCRFDEVARLMKALEGLPDNHSVKEDKAYKIVKQRGYIAVPRIVSITLPEPAPEFGDADFSPDALEKRRQQGYAQAIDALKAPPQDPCSVLDGANE